VSGAYKCSGKIRQFIDNREAGFAQTAGKYNLVLIGTLDDHKSEIVHSPPYFFKVIIYEIGIFEQFPIL
jgi:hypothetical protein